jgi:DNA polymerase/3'-5' exonuclease PolX
MQDAGEKMKIKPEFDLAQAMKSAKELLFILYELTERAEIVGSIRRRKVKVHDIDIVLIPKVPLENKLLSGNIEGIPFEIYIADHNTYEVLRLIRSGSADHNKMLCQKAKEKGWQLKAGGTGLVDKDGNIIDNTERGILEKLLGKYVEPQDREVRTLWNFKKE